MKVFLAVFLAIANFLPMRVPDHFSKTPEAALAEYINAFKARDVERFLAATDFTNEAIREIQSGAPRAQPTVEEIQEKSDSIRSDLREHFSKFGFKPATFDDCTQVTKFQDSATQVRILLNCKAPLGSLALPVRIALFESGWRVTYGG